MKSNNIKYQKMLFELQLGRVSKVWAPEHIRDKNLTKLNAGQVRKKWKFISQFLQLVRWSVNLTIPPFKNMNIKQRRKKICFNQTLWEDLTAVQLHLLQSQLYNQLFQQQAAEKQSKAALKLPGCRPHTGAITHTKQAFHSKWQGMLTYRKPEVSKWKAHGGAFI